MMEHTNSVGEFLRCIQPEPQEILTQIVLTIGALILIAFGAFTNHMYTSTAVVHTAVEQFGGQMHRFLAWIDLQRGTDVIVTFVVWMVVGAIVYAAGAMLIRMWRIQDMHREIASDFYIHPSGFSKKTYWRTVFLYELCGASLLAGLILLGAGIALWLIPGVLRVFTGLFAVVTLRTVFAVLVGISGTVCASLILLLVVKMRRFYHILFDVAGQ